MEGCQKKKSELETLTVLLRGWTLLKVRGVMTVNMERAKSPWLCGAKWSPPRQMGWGVHVFEESVLERPYWVLGLGVVVSHFAAVKAEVQRGTGKDLRPSALGVSAAARQVTTGDSVCPLR